MKQIKVQIYVIKIKLKKIHEKENNKNTSTVNQVGKSQQILLTKGQRDIFNNSQGLKKIQ